MLKGKESKRLLIIVYIAMVLCACILNFFSNRVPDFRNLFVTIILFIIAFLIYRHAYIRFKIVDKIIKSLDTAKEKIENDHHEKNDYLWNEYKFKENIFDCPILDNCYQEYKEEIKRIDSQENSHYKCSLEDFINRDIIDKEIQRNILNLAAGTMTGLGILGTFLGLSIGLQSFSTGTAEEISKSIAPLMDGIKVAFHTSIYGMVLSLAFNYIYKNKLDEANESMDDFLDTFEKCVVPDVQNDYFSMMMKYQKEQTACMSDMLGNLGGKIAEKMGEILSPQFEKLNETFNDFAQTVSQNQVEGVSEIVDNFLEEMDRCLGDKFKELGIVIEETCEWQKKNSTYMEEILQKIGGMTHNIQEINELSGKTIESMSEYVSQMEELQNVINQNFMSVNIQIEENTKTLEKQHDYIDILVQYEKNISEASTSFMDDMEKQINILHELGDDISGSAKKNMEDIRHFAETCGEEITEVAREQIQSILSLSKQSSGEMDRASKDLREVTENLNAQLEKSLYAAFNSFDKNLADITRHLSGTITEVKATTERVPKVIEAAYEQMEETLTLIDNTLKVAVD